MSRESREYAYLCCICLIPEADGTVSAVVLNLPGVGSCGATEEDALANVVEAIRGVIESYQAGGEAIPWQAGALPDGAQLRQVWVNIGERP